MNTLTAWLVTIIGLVLALAEFGWLAALTAYNGWIIAIAVLVIGISALIKIYKK